MYYINRKEGNDQELIQLPNTNCLYLFTHICRANITTNVEDLNEMDADLQTTMGRVQEGNNRIAALELGVKDLKLKAEQLRNNASDIQSKDVEGDNNNFHHFYTPPHNSGEVLWFHVGRPCVF